MSDFSIKTYAFGSNGIISNSLVVAESSQNI